MKKTIKITSESGYVMQNGNSIAFLAKLPEHAVVDGVKVNGEYLEDIFSIESGEKRPDVIYPTHKFYDDHRVCAVMNVGDGVAENDLLKLASIGSIYEFEVIYHEECIVEG